MRTLICTNGTSIAQGCSKLSWYSSRLTDWNDPADDLKSEVVARLAALETRSVADRVRVSAEVNSLDQIGLEPDDEIILLASDTAEGRICAEAVAGVLHRWMRHPSNRITVTRIVGLQVHDQMRLREQGLVRLMEAVLDRVHDPQARNGGIILNQTGGFKGIVPFITVLGMLFRLRTVYLFEGAASLITLPPLPITFDLALFQRAAPAMEAMRRHGTLPVESFYRLVEGAREEERDLFNGLVEVENGLAILSPLAMVLNTVESTGARRVRVSADVEELYAKLRGAQRATVARLLDRVASPLWRMTHRHAFTGTDLDVYKPGNTAERLAGFIDGDDVMICCVFVDHEIYERDLPKLRRSHFEHTAFESWSPSDPEPVASAAPSSGAEASRKQRNDLAHRLGQERDQRRKSDEALRTTLATLRKTERELSSALLRIEQLEAANRAGVQSSS